MTISEAQDLVEPFEDDVQVGWGCVDHSIPSVLWDFPNTSMDTFKQWLSEQQPYDNMAIIYQEKMVTVKQWLSDDKQITFYMGYSDE